MKKGTGRRNKKIFPLLLTAAGLALLIAAAALEASDYPWRRLFGIASQSADAMGEPSPIVLDQVDQAAKIAIVVPTIAPPTETPPAPTVEPEEEPPDVEEEPPDVEEEPPGVRELPSLEAQTNKAQPPASYVLLGSLKIPALDILQNLLEDTQKQMKYGVGHVISTAMPGEEGNCAIAGHRSTSFRYLDKLNMGDLIVVKYNSSTFTYTAYDSFTVLPSEVWVLDSVEEEPYALTLITCTPYMVHSHRLIVRGRLTDVDGMTPEDYFSLRQSAPDDAE